MKKVLIAAFAAMFIVGCTESEAGDVYVQGGVGVTDYNFNGASEDQTGTNYFGALGYIFDNNLGIEGEYEYVNNADLSDDLKVNNQQNINFYGVGRLPLDNKDKVNLVAKAGFGYGRTKLSGIGSDSDRSWYPAIGLGIEWMITDSWGVVGLVDYKNYDYSISGSKFSADPISYKAGVQYRF